jgi:hypothetical protein
MFTSTLCRRVSAFITAGAVASVGLIGTGSGAASAVTCVSGTGVRSRAPGAVASLGNAWAVGQYITGTG